MPLILASASPRRQHLLRQAGYDFTVHAADLDEDAYLGRLAPIELAVFLARAKASEVAQHHPADATLAADTVVAFGDTAIGKPRDIEHAHEILTLLAGVTHIVITAVAVRCPAREIDLSARAMSAVRLRPMSADELDSYLASGLWKGKAGGYGIQDDGGFVELIGGSRTNVIGLPVRQTVELLGRAGVSPSSPIASDLEID